MYITDKNTYCWTTDDTCGEPQDTIQDAIENFYEVFPKEITTTVYLTKENL